MRAASIGFALLPLLAGQVAPAQTPQPKDAPAQSAPAVEDFKPASSNQGGKEYPQVNSERRARFRIVAPGAQPSGIAAPCQSGGRSRALPAKAIRSPSSATAPSGSTAVGVTTRPVSRVRAGEGAGVTRA